MKKIKTPELAIDTKVFVRDNAGQSWMPRHFMKWNEQGIVCFAHGDTSFSAHDKDGSFWKYWKVAGGKFKGETNYKVAMELEVDAKVYVKRTVGDDWTERHFKGWEGDGRIVCFSRGLTSFTGGGGSIMPFWKIADGKFEGETNLKE